MTLQAPAILWRLVVAVPIVAAFLYRRRDINPQLYLTQLLADLPDTPVSGIDRWLPHRWKKIHAAPAAEAPPAES